MKNDYEKRVFEGNLSKMDSTEIYLNVTHLNHGDYVILITDKNKVIQKTTFKKMDVNPDKGNSLK